MQKFGFNNLVFELVTNIWIVINNFWGNLETNILHFNLTGYKTRTWFQLNKKEKTEKQFKRVDFPS